MPKNLIRIRPSIKPGLNIQDPDQTQFFIMEPTKTSGFGSASLVQVPDSLAFDGQASLSLRGLVRAVHRLLVSCVRLLEAITAGQYFEWSVHLVAGLSAAALAAG